MRIIKDNYYATSFPLRFTCGRCGSELEADESDVYADDRYVVDPLWVNCSLCNAIKNINDLLTITDAQRLRKRITEQREAAKLPYA